MGGACGFAGFKALSSLGGNAWAWVVVWEIWTAAHLALSRFAPEICKRARARGSDGSVRMEWMRIVLGLGVPLLAAWAPFA